MCLSSRTGSAGTASARTSRRRQAFRPVRRLARERSDLICSPLRRLVSIPTFVPTLARKGRDSAALDVAALGHNSRSQPYFTLDGRPNSSYTIFEGTSEIQRLVIARALTGLRVE